jgi:hypothetical protein
VCPNNCWRCEIEDIHFEEDLKQFISLWDFGALLKQLAHTVSLDEVLSLLEQRDDQHREEQVVQLLTHFLI